MTLALGAALLELMLALLELLELLLVFIMGVRFGDAGPSTGLVSGLVIFL